MLSLSVGAFPPFRMCLGQQCCTLHVYSISGPGADVLQACSAYINLSAVAVWPTCSLTSRPLLQTAAVKAVEEQDVLRNGAGLSNV